MINSPDVPIINRLTWLLAGKEGVLKKEFGLEKAILELLNIKEVESVIIITKNNDFLLLIWLNIYSF